MVKDNTGFGTNNDSRYHNTWKLLSNYRSVLWNVTLSVSDMRMEFREEYESDIEDFLSSVYMAGADLSGTKLERHARTIERSNKMIKLINYAVEMLRKKPKDGEKFYWVLYYAYLSPEELESVDEIVNKLKEIQAFKRLKKLSKATYYRIRKDAVRELSLILWGYSSRDCNEVLTAFFPE